ncbi:MAG: glycosyltransferase, partial [Anaerolineae bacterium]|nr:glycosyltransferase [Anaerolineae bacterium]NIN95857.1 glycosyltransferase [Anaerolineae bacterium]NIQ78822.1 glycosyltransferase [Anaerolineae bacterium]
MRIAYVSYGNNVYDHRFLAKMVERGHAPTLISYWPGDVDFHMDHVEFIHWDPRFPRGAGVLLRHLRPLFWAYHLRRTLECIQPDVLHTGYVQYSGFAGALCGFHPVLLMPWGSDILLDSGRSFYHSVVTRFTIIRADMITCDCELVKNRIVDLTGYPEARIVIFPWGIDLGVFKPEDRPSKTRRELGWEDKRVLIMTRKFDKPVYGIEYFLHALPEVVRQCPETRVV